MESIVLVSLFSISAAMAGAGAGAEVFSFHSLGRNLAKCLGGSAIFPCIQQETIHSLDLILADNSTWQYSDFIQFESDRNYSMPKRSMARQANGSFSEEIGERLLELAQSRSVRLKMNPRSLDDDDEDLDSVEGGDDRGENRKKWYLNNSLKGRKKKGKDKGMAIFGGLAMVAMLAQMFLGKVLLIAGSAFVMAKIALIVSLFTSLKTKSTGSSNIEHIVAHTDVGGGSHNNGGYHRSLPYFASTEFANKSPVEDHLSDVQISDYYQYDAGPYKHDFKYI